MLLHDMNTHKSLTTAAIASIVFFSLFGAQAAHAAQDENVNQQSESIEVALVAIGFFDAQEERQDEEPVSNDEITDEETAEEDVADDPIAEIIIPDPDTDNTNNDVINDIEVNSNGSVVEAASIVETTPDTEGAPSLNVTADDTDHNALPTTGMELSLAFLGLGLAGIGGTLLAVRRRLMIK